MNYRLKNQVKKILIGIYPNTTKKLPGTLPYHLDRVAYSWQLAAYKPSDANTVFQIQVVDLFYVTKLQRRCALCILWHLDRIPPTSAQTHLDDALLDVEKSSFSVHRLFPPPPKKNDNHDTKDLPKIDQSLVR